ncbi:multidrug efflux SMR transporter [Paenibacillus sp. W2I17]|uniref:DMT family transporter n=1 Tax=Paenibacillus sp. W2I17 TaxID=3042311 RepID=UPI0027881250|nr:multidrug efflux SMR transporter [Paenibacillus sp. W2I17]MDQ0656044.1 multidrug resistance protein EbrA [Paenibacillus sp. W2I17]
MTYLILAFAILSEVFGSSMMKISDGFKKILPTIGTIAGMGIAFFLLSIVLKTLPLGTAYAIWSGVGIVLTALVGVLIYKEKLSTPKTFGLILVVAGVVFMKLATN